MATNKIDLFWQIFQAISTGSGDITDALDAISKADRTKVENYFNDVIDQVSFGTADYNRLRKFLVDLYASHRALTTSSTQVSDPHSMPNSDLDELFRSFGYEHSTVLHSIDENPLEQKVQFFLDLVNLYKVKGTPQSLVDVLQYYGVTEVDIYEFFLKLQDANTLYFDGKAVAGTTVGAGDIIFPYTNLTESDPHWLYTEQQILDLNNSLSINLPSKTPYIGVQPVVQIDGPEISIIERLVQDQYDYYNTYGVLPTADAEMSYIGEVRTLLELYLSAIYTFNKLFDVGSSDATSFICYDGTNTETTDIIAEYNLITQQPVTRAAQKSQLQQYYDTFTRMKARNFLQVKSDAGTYLNTIAPDIKINLDGAGDQSELLYSLLNDLSIWVRNNIGLGFVNFGFILFGVQTFFSELKPIIEFFKPYRARLLLLEALQVRNRLMNTIVVEDEFSFNTKLDIHDWITADSIACCDTDVTGEHEVYDGVDGTSITTITIPEESCGVGSHAVCMREIIDPTPILVWKGFWRSDLLYSVGDGVPDGDNNRYVCKLAHTSSSTNSPGVGAGWTTYWTKVSEIQCSDSTGATYYSRDTYDCGSYFDYGAVMDDEPFIQWEQSIDDPLNCVIYDTTNISPFIISELSSDSTPGLFLDATSDTTATLVYDFWQYGGFRDFDGIASDSTSGGVYVDKWTQTYVDLPSTATYDFVRTFVGFAPQLNSGAYFDCTYGFDAVNIRIELPEEICTGYLLTEGGGKLTQENDGGILIGISSCNDPVADPVFNPQSGTYPEGTQVTITTTTPGATITYTTDGSDPVPGSHGTVYTGPITL